MATQRILIIDIDKPSVDAVKKALHEYDAEFQIIDDSVDIKFEARTYQPDLIILCAELSKKAKGYAECSKLKRDPELKRIPLILTSAEATQKKFDKHKELPTRADDYLLKPFEIPLLVEKVSGLIGLSRHAGKSPAGTGEDFSLDFDVLEVEESEPDGAPTADHLDTGYDPVDAVEVDFEELSLDESFDTIEPSPPPPEDTEEPDVPLPPTPPLAQEGTEEAPVSAPPVAQSSSNQQLLDALGEASRYKGQISELEIQLESLQLRLTKRERELEGLRDKTTDRDRDALDFRDRLTQKEKEVLDLRGQVNSLAKTNEDIDSELATVKKRLDMLRRDKESVEAESNQKVVELSNIQAHVSSMQGEVDRVRTALAGEKSALAEQVSTLELMVGERDGELSTLRETLSALESELAELKIASSETEEELRAEIASLQERSAAFQTIESGLQHTIDEKSAAVTELEDQLLALQQELEDTTQDAERRIAEAQEAADTAVSEAQAQAEEQLTQAQERCDDAVAQAKGEAQKAITDTNELAELEKGELQTKIAELETARSTDAETIELLNAEKDDLQASVRETTEVMQGDIDRLNAQKADLESNIATLESEKNDITQRSTALHQQINHLQDVHHGLKSHLKEALRLLERGAGDAEAE